MTIHRRAATLTATLLAVAATPVAGAAAQGAPPPPEHRSIISVRVGSTFVESPCLDAVGQTLISPGRPWQPGDPVPPVEDRVPASPNGCAGLQPVVLRRARHMTLTLLGQSPQVGASWFANGQSTPLTVRPVGEPPSAVWFLQLPLSSGKLVLHMWYPVVTSALGRVTQSRGDYKVAVRRGPRQPPPRCRSTARRSPGTTTADEADAEGRPGHRGCRPT